MRQLSVVQEWI